MCQRSRSGSNVFSKDRHCGGTRIGFEEDEKIFPPFWKSFKEGLGISAELMEKLRFRFFLLEVLCVLVGFFFSLYINGVCEIV